VRRRGHRVRISGRATDRGCGRISRVAVSIARRTRGGRCRYVGRRGRLGRPRSCRRVRYVTARGRETWSRRRRRLRKGRYVVRAFAFDEVGLSGPRSRARRFRIR
ncbi:MAG TPA: hypothetical protein VF587_04930, partial [Solirubrobacteraceae bacterium]